MRSELHSGNFETLAIALPHALAVKDLPRHHGDPFDRILVAQAVVERIPILGADEALDAYEVSRLW